ncbi:hypothetical protein X975_13738, partial [Stegodyphus mimosarum]
LFQIQEVIDNCHIKCFPKLTIRRIIMLFGVLHFFLRHEVLFSTNTLYCKLKTSY